MSTKKPKARTWNYSNIPVRQETKEKFREVHESTRIPYGEIADMAITALLKTESISLRRPKQLV